MSYKVIDTRSDESKEKVISYFCPNCKKIMRNLDTDNWKLYGICNDCFADLETHLAARKIALEDILEPFEAGKHDCSKEISDILKAVFSHMKNLVVKLNSFVKE